MWHTDLFSHSSNLRLTSWELEGAMEDKAEKNTEFQLVCFAVACKEVNFTPDNPH